MSQKRYRYTGKEKDEETGLAYHGARYYAPWLGRWERPDPSGMRDGPNRMVYCRNNPVGLTDATGTAAGDPDDVRAHSVRSLEEPDFVPSTAKEGQLRQAIKDVRALTASLGVDISANLEGDFILQSDQPLAQYDRKGLARQLKEEGVSAKAAKPLLEIGSGQPWFTVSKFATVGFGREKDSNTAPHEVVHLAAFGGPGARAGLSTGALQEAGASFYARKAVELSGGTQPPASVTLYTGAELVFSTLADLSPSAMAKAFFQGDDADLRALVEDKYGAGTYDLILEASEKGPVLGFPAMGRAIGFDETVIDMFTTPDLSGAIPGEDPVYRGGAHRSVLGPLLREWVDPSTR